MEQEHSHSMSGRGQQNQRHPQAGVRRASVRSALCPGSHIAPSSPPPRSCLTGDGATDCAAFSRLATQHERRHSSCSPPCSPTNTLAYVSPLPASHHHHHHHHRHRHQVRQQVADQLHATFSASEQPDLQPVLSLLADTHWYKRVSTTR